MKNAKRMLSILLACMMAFGCMSVGAYAEDGHEHVFNETKMKHYKLPTCEADGEDIYYCTVGECGEEKHATVSKLGHKFTIEVKDKTKVATCTEDGQKIMACCRQGCTKTEIKKIDKLGHNFVKEDAQCVKSTCTDVGKDVFKCERCSEIKETEVPKLAHSFTIRVDAQCVAPSCRTEGKEVFKCASANCEETNTKTLSKVAHNYFEGEVVAPTCTEDGYTPLKCSACGHTDKNNKIVPATGHNYQEDGAEGHKCNKCNQTAEHRFTEWKEDGNSRFFKNGTQSCHCRDCGYEKTEPVQPTNGLYKLAHGTFGFVEFLVVVPFMWIAKILHIDLP